MNADGKATRSNRAKDPQEEDRQDEERQLDRELRDSFPASDPPSFNPGTSGKPARKKRRKAAAGSRAP